MSSDWVMHGLGECYVQCGGCSDGAEIVARVVDDAVTQLDPASIPAGWSVSIVYGELQAQCGACKLADLAAIGAR